MRDAAEAVIRLIPKLMRLANDCNNGINGTQLSSFHQILDRMQKRY